MRDEHSDPVRNFRTQLTARTRHLAFIGDYLVANPLDAATKSAAAVARELNCSAPQVRRFASHLGFEDYSDLKRHFRRQFKTGAAVPAEHARSFGDMA